MAKYEVSGDKGDEISVNLTESPLDYNLCSFERNGQRKNFVGLPPHLSAQFSMINYEVTASSLGLYHFNNS